MPETRELIGFALVTAVVVTVEMSPTARAQSGGPIAKPFAIELGAFTPAGKDTRNYSGSTHFLLDTTYEFGRIPDRSLLYGAYFDYIFQTSATNDVFDPSTGANGSVTGRMSAFGVGLQARYRFPSSGRSRFDGLRPYVGGGLGVYGVSAKESGYGGINDAGAVVEDGYSHTTTGLGGKLVVGVQSRSGFLGEVSYHFLPDVNGYDLSGYAFSVGYRF